MTDYNEYKESLEKKEELEEIIIPGFNVEKKKSWCKHIPQECKLCFIDICSIVAPVCVVLLILIAIYYIIIITT